MIKSILLATAVSLAVVTTAGAVTAPAKPQAPSSELIQVKKRWHGDNWNWNKKHWKHGHYRHGYHRPPPGWRSYSARPWGWRRRGCLAIGPLWYCP
jgi:hypothetical protein